MSPAPASVVVASEPALLEVEGLTVQRDGRALLAGVDLAVAPRSIHALVGPNGAGKSTLLAAVLGELPFGGRIRFHWRGSGRIGYVPQRFALERTLPISVAEFLALARQRRPICLGLAPSTRRKTDELLERVGLAGLGRRPLAVLSGGELRRVLLANAIDPAPELLVCDEPATGLDSESVVLVDRLLAALRDEQGVTALVVSHDRDGVRRLADRVTELAAPVGSGRGLLTDSARTAAQDGPTRTDGR